MSEGDDQTMKQDVDGAIRNKEIENSRAKIKIKTSQKLKVASKKRKYRRARQRALTRNLGEEMVPRGIDNVGWRNVEGDFKIISKRVFIIDSGVADLPDEFNIDTSLAKNFVAGEDSDQWIDCEGHGTHVAGTIAARENGSGVVGVAAGAVIVPLRVLDCRGEGFVTDFIAAINYVAQHAWPEDIVNISLGIHDSTEVMDIAIQKAAASTGAYFVIAAGNEGEEAKYFSPARVQGHNIYTVCALNRRCNKVASFSNYGKPPISVCAPGSNIVSLNQEGEMTLRSGTSMAAPHVSGSLLLGPLKLYGSALSRRDNVTYPTLQRDNETYSVLKQNSSRIFQWLTH